MIGIIDTGMGNTGSIMNMLKKVGGTGVLCGDASMLEKADKLILPGIGSYDQGMKRLNDMGLISALNKKVVVDEIPILGICLGMQLMTKGSEEGKLPGLGWIDARTSVFRFQGRNNNLRVPHMGWNSVKTVKNNPLFKGLDEQARFYFVHSYYVECRNREDVLGVTCHGIEFDSSIGSGNIFGVQFHPEKSHKFGMRLLKNFLEY